MHFEELSVFFPDYASFLTDPDPIETIKAVDPSGRTIVKLFDEIVKTEGFRANQKLNELAEKIFAELLEANSGVIGRVNKRKRSKQIPFKLDKEQSVRFHKLASDYTRPEKNDKVTNNKQNETAGHEMPSSSSVVSTPKYEIDEPSYSEEKDSHIPPAIPEHKLISPKIVTSRIVTTHILETLHKLMSEWKDIAIQHCKNNKLPEKASVLNELKKALYVIRNTEYAVKIIHNIVVDKQLADANCEVKKLRKKNKKSNTVTSFAKNFSSIQSSIKSKKKYTYSSVYVAEVDQKVQGIAIKIFNSDYNRKYKPPAAFIEYIVTHPDNIADPTKKVKGIGTALIKHVVSDIEVVNETNTLELYSLATSIGFYKSIGFEESVGFYKSIGFEENSDVDNNEEYRMDKKEIYNQKKMTLSIPIGAREPNKAIVSNSPSPIDVLEEAAS